MRNDYYFVSALKPLGKVVDFCLFYYFSQHTIFFFELQMYDNSSYLEQKPHRTFFRQSDKMQMQSLTFLPKELFAIIGKGSIQQDTRWRKESGKFFQTTVIAFA